MSEEILLWLLDSGYEMGRCTINGKEVRFWCKDDMEVSAHSIYDHFKDATKPVRFIKQ